MKIKFLLCLLISYYSMGQNRLNWQVFYPKENIWLNLGEKGSVQEAFLNNQKLPDPFYGTNEKAYQWIENENWTFKADFFLSEQLFLSEKVDLLFPSIDTYASIYLNDSLLGTSQNTFVPFERECRKVLKLGYNQLRIVFTSPKNYHSKTWKNQSFQYPAPNDLDEIAVAPLTRKPQYQFGWDWALRMNTIGLNAPVQFITYSTNRISHLGIQTKTIQAASAQMQINIQFKEPLAKDVEVKSSLFGTFTLKAGQAFYVVHKTLNNPTLWWPRSQGEPFLYEDEMLFNTSELSYSEEKKVKFGVRTTELLQERDSVGTSYVIRINGKPIFCKGADYIPDDIFISRIEPSKIEKVVDNMVTANFNMVRVWGGGYYPSNYFYELCDEKGLMVWQDFMFACAMYPGDSLFLDNVKAEFEYQIPRIAKHPSVVLFNGNNEVDVAWKNWGFQTKYNLFGEKVKIIEKAYKDLFQTLAPAMVEQYALIPYIHTSPLSNWGKDEYYKSGSQHYWGVWHGKDPISDFGRKSGRFNAEYGFQSFPEYRTLLSFSTKKDWDLNSEVMKHHQKSYVGNGMIAKHADLLYGQAKNFEQFVYFSQLTQAKAIDIAVTAHKLSAPLCMGTIYWQLNDCWPSPTWSSLDYDLNWKALHYKAKSLYNECSFLKDDLGKSPKWFLHAENDAKIDYELEVLTLEGNLLFKKEGQIKLKALQSLNLYPEDFEIYARQNYVVQIVYTVNDTIKKQSIIPHLTNQYKTAKKPNVTLSLSQVDLLSKSAILKIENDDFVTDLWIYSLNKKIHLEDNFLTYLPGEHFVKILFEEVPAISDLQFQYR